MNNKIFVGGNEYPKNERWMLYFLDSDNCTICNSDEIIKKTQDFQNNIFYQSQIGVVEEIIPSATDINAVVALIERLSGEPVINKVERVERGTKEELREYITFANDMYNKLINITSRKTGGCMINPASVKLTTTTTTTTEADDIDAEITLRSIVNPLAKPNKSGYNQDFEKNRDMYKRNKVNQKMIKQIFNYMNDHINDRITIDDFGIDVNNNIVFRPSQTEIINTEPAFILSGYYDSFNVALSCHSIFIIIGRPDAEFIEILNEESAICISMPHDKIPENIKQQVAKYSKWLIDQKRDIPIDECIKQLKSIGFEIRLINAQEKTVKFINQFKYTEKDYGNIMTAYTYEYFSNLDRIDFSEYDEKIHPLVLSSKFEVGFHGHIKNNKLIISSIDEEVGGLNSIQVFPMDFLLGHTHPFSRYAGLDIEEPSESDFNIFMYNVTVIKVSAASLIAAPEGLYILIPTKILLTYINNQLHSFLPRTFVKCMNLADKLTSNLYPTIPNMGNTFRTMISKLTDLYAQNGVRLLFRPTKGFDLDRKLNIRATLYSLPNDLFKKQFDITPKLDEKYFVNADYTEMDSFDFIKAGHDPASYILNSIIFDGNKVLYAPYSTVELESLDSLSPNNAMNKTFFANVSVHSVIIQCYDEKFPFSLLLDSVRSIVNRFIYELRSKWIIILSDSYISIFNLTKNELYGPLDRRTKKHITKNGSNSK